LANSSNNITTTTSSISLSPPTTTIPSSNAIAALPLIPSTPPNTSTPPPSRGKRQQTPNFNQTESNQVLDRVERQQEESFKILKEIRAKLYSNDGKDESNTLESTFRSFMNALQNTSDESKFQKVESIANSLTNDDFIKLLEFVSNINPTGNILQLEKKRQRTS
jgi:hypothetical protein